jgi:hypothetical protein
MVLTGIDHVPVGFVLDIKALHEAEYTPLMKILKRKAGASSPWLKPGAPAPGFGVAVLIIAAAWIFRKL